MQLVLIGCGSLAKRRILPAAEACTHIHSVSVASKSVSQKELCDFSKVTLVYQDYLTALAASHAHRRIAYISLANNLHAEWIEAALVAGCHVIVDKPAVLRAADAERLAALAAESNLALVEANVWTRHPIAQMLRQVHAPDGDARAVFVSASFTNPPLNADNFRYSRKHGGGILWDRLSYALSCGSLFFDDDPLAHSGRVLSRGGGDDVDLDVSLRLDYPDGSLNCDFSLAAEYTNRLAVISRNAQSTVERIFTPTADFVGEIMLASAGRKERIVIPAADSFRLFFDEVISAIHQDAAAHYGAQLVRDAQLSEDIHSRLAP